MRFLKQAVDYEVQRQITLVESGGKVEQETRLFNTKTGETHTMRSKENANDYRYFPEPDLPPILLTEERIARLKSTLPELPDAKKDRFVKVLELSEYDAAVLCQDQDTAAYFESALIDGVSAKLVANWLSSELFSALNKEGLEIGQSKISAAHLAELVRLIEDGTISGKIAKTVFAQMWETGKAPQSIVEEQGLQQISDPSVIVSAIHQILSDNADKVAQYKAGKEQLFGFFVGNVLKHFDGKANPELVNSLLKTSLS